MFFLPAELVKKAGNEVLPHWMGDLGRSQDVSSSSVTESVFSFLAGQCNRFPILPPLASCCLELSEVCQHFGSFSPAIDSNSVIIVILTVVLIIKRAVALSCGRQNAFSVWEWRYPKLDYRGGGGGVHLISRDVWKQQIHVHVSIPSSQTNKILTLEENQKKKD